MWCLLALLCGAYGALVGGNGFPKERLDHLWEHLATWESALNWVIVGLVIGVLYVARNYRIGRVKGAIIGAILFPAWALVILGLSWVIGQAPGGWEGSWPFGIVGALVGLLLGVALGWGTDWLMRRLKLHQESAA